MTQEIYNAIAKTLLTGGALAFLLAVGCLGAALIGSNRRRWLIGSFALLAAAPCMVGTTYAIRDFVYLPSLRRANEQQMESHIRSATLVKIGDMAPLFEIQKTDGQTFSLDAYRGQTVLLTFFNIHCGPCLRELPEVQALWETHGSSGKLQVIAIGAQDSAEEALAFGEKNGLTFDVAADPAGKVYAMYARHMLPNTYVISPTGEVVYNSNGFPEGAAAELRQSVEVSLGLQREGL